MPGTFSFTLAKVKKDGVEKVILRNLLAMHQ